MANYFLDFSAANNGDGSDGAQAGAPAAPGAFNQLTAAENVTILAGDSVYLRRTGTASVKTILFKNGVKYYGWPKAADENFATRPANTVDATWNASLEDWCFFDAPSGAENHVDNEFWRLNSYTITSQNHWLNTVSGVSGNLFWNHCRQTGTSPGNQMQARCQPGNWGSGAYKLRDFQFVHTSGTGTALATWSPSAAGWIDVEFSVIYGVASAQNFPLTFGNSNGSTRNRVVVMGYTNAGSGRMTFSYGGTNRGIYDIRVAPGATVPWGQITFSEPGINGVQFRLTNINQTGNPNASGIQVDAAGSDGALNISAINCVFEGVTDDIKFSTNFQTYISGRNVTFSTSKVAFGPNGNVLDPAQQSIEIEDFGNVKGGWLRMTSRGFHQQSSAYRDIAVGVRDSALMETRATDYSGVILPVPFMYAGPWGKEPLRKYVTAGAPRTITVFGYHKDWSGNQNKGNIWLEVDYYDAGVGAHVTLVTTFDPPAAALTADGSTWIGVAGGTPFKMAVTFTPGQNGYCFIRVNLNDSYIPAGNRSKIYVDPLVVLS